MSGVNEHEVFRGIVRGMLPFYLLTLIGEQPRHGTLIRQVLAHMSGGAWKPSPGSIYPLLKKLEKAGWIESEWQAGRAAAKRVYSITSMGRKELPALRQRLLEDLKDAREIIEAHITALEEGGHAAEEAEG